MNQPNPTTPNLADPRFDPAVRRRRNRKVAVILAIIAVAFYVGIGLRWHLN
ncbi:MAG TPA: hypothetical protein VGG27_03255 [Magnetospirillaceae bacterium]|jgi:hypothetical protein